MNKQSHLLDIIYLIAIRHNIFIEKYFGTKKSYIVAQGFNNNDEVQFIYQNQIFRNLAHVAMLVVNYCTNDLISVFYKF